jgi:hypothetical protein
MLKIYEFMNISIKSLKLNVNIDFHQIHYLMFRQPKLTVALFGKVA